MGSRHGWIDSRKAQTLTLPFEFGVLIYHRYFTHFSFVSSVFGDLGIPSLIFTILTIPEHWGWVCLTMIKSVLFAIEKDTYFGLFGLAWDKALWMGVSKMEYRRGRVNDKFEFFQTFRLMDL